MKLDIRATTLGFHFEAHLLQTFQEVLILVRKGKVSKSCMIFKTKLCLQYSKYIINASNP